MLKVLSWFKFPAWSHYCRLFYVTSSTVSMRIFCMLLQIFGEEDLGQRELLAYCPKVWSVSVNSVKECWGKLSVTTGNYLTF